MMRLAALATIALFGLAEIGPALANSSYRGGYSRVYFWEDSHTYGWSDSANYEVGAVPPRITKRMSLEESCGRRVGRMIRVDSASLIRFNQLTDECVRNGGRL